MWGDWSVESQYVTLGQAAAPAPAAAAAAAPPAGFSKKRNKKGADKGTEKKMSSAAAQQAAADEQHAIQQLQVCCWTLLLLQFLLWCCCGYWRAHSNYPAYLSRHLHISALPCKSQPASPVDSQLDSQHCIKLCRSPGYNIMFPSTPTFLG